MPPAPPGTRPTGPSCPRIRNATAPDADGGRQGQVLPAVRNSSTNRPSLPSRCPSALPSEFCIGESLLSASPEQFRKRYHASKGKPRPWGRYSASTAMRATFSKGSLARRTGTDAVCKRCRILKGIPSLCKRYNTCKAWYRCTSGGISVKAAPAVPPLRDAPGCGGRPTPTPPRRTPGHSKTLRGRKLPIGVGRALAARERREELG